MTYIATDAAVRCKFMTCSLLEFSGFNLWLFVFLAFQLVSHCFQLTYILKWKIYIISVKVNIWTIHLHHLAVLCKCFAESDVLLILFLSHVSLPYCCIVITVAMMIVIMNEYCMKEYCNWNWVQLLSDMKSATCLWQCLRSESVARLWQYFRSVS